MQRQPVRDDVFIYQESRVLPQSTTTNPLIILREVEHVRASHSRAGLSSDEPVGNTRIRNEPFVFFESQRWCLCETKQASRLEVQTVEGLRKVKGGRCRGW